MTNKEFLENLNKSSPTFEEKLLSLQFFIDNFPVFIDETKKIGNVLFKTGNKFWTSLLGVDIVHTGLPESETQILYAFNKLVERKKELTEFLTKLDI